MLYIPAIAASHDTDQRHTLFLNIAHNHSLASGDPFRGKHQLSEPVILMRIHPGIIEDYIWPETLETLSQPALQRPQIGVISEALVQSDIEA